MPGLDPFDGKGDAVELAAARVEQAGAGDQHAAADDGDRRRGLRRRAIPPPQSTPLAPSPPPLGPPPKAVSVESSGGPLSTGFSRTRPAKSARATFQLAYGSATMRP